MDNSYFTHYFNSSSQCDCPRGWRAGCSRTIDGSGYRDVHRCSNRGIADCHPDTNTNAITDTLTDLYRQPNPYPDFDQYPHLDQFGSRSVPHAAYMRMLDAAVTVAPDMTLFHAPMGGADVTAQPRQPTIQAS